MIRAGRPDRIVRSITGAAITLWVLTVAAGLLTAVEPAAINAALGMGFWAMMLTGTAAWLRLTEPRR